MTSDEGLRWPWTWRTNATQITAQAGEAETLLSATGKELQRFCFSPDGALLAVAGHYHSVVLDLRHPRSETPFSQGIPQSFVGVSPDNQWLAAADVFGKGVTVWDRQSGQFIRTLLPNEQAHLAFGLDGRTLATMSKECVFWDTTTWQPHRRVQVQPGPLGGGSLAFSGDNRLLAVVERYQLIKLLDPQTGDELATLTPPAFLNLVALAISADGSAVAAATQGRTIYFWNLRTLGHELAGLGLEW